MRLRKNHSDATEVEVSGEIGKRRRRDGRGLGPFSGGQLTLIIVTLAVVIGFPVAAFSVTGTAMNITDPVTAANKAKVDAKGNLNGAIHDATSGVAAKVDAKNNLYTATRDAVSGVAAKVDSSGQQLVSAVPGILAVSALTGQINTSGSWTTVWSVGPKSVVTALNVDTYAVNPGVNSALDFGESLDGCASVTAFNVALVNPGEIGLTSIDLGSQGLILGAGVQLCVRNNDPANLSAAVFALGHT